MRDYAHPEVLVDTAWVEAHRRDPDVRLVEVDRDRGTYDKAHLPAACGWGWASDLCDPVRRDILARPEFEALMARSGITNDTTVVLYGDHDNRYAAWAFWEMKFYGHADVRLMDGGRQKWLYEGRETTRQAPAPGSTEYAARDVQRRLRALLPETKQGMEAGDMRIVDVRAPQEYSGEILAPRGMAATCQRGGHIPGAVNVPWAEAVNCDGTFRAATELETLYRAHGVTPELPVITYCRVGERSSHSWFVLKYLLGYPDVRHYDGAWTEWGNLVGMPVARGHEPWGA